MRKLLYKHVPQNLIERPKAGFAIPLGKWLNNDLKDYVQDLIGPQSLKEAGLLEPESISKMILQHKNGVRNWEAPIWNALMLHQWMRQWKLD